MRRFAIYDTRGVEAWEQQMADMGVPAGAIAPPDADWLDTREARNAADAVQAARAEWPEIPVQYLDAREITDIPAAPARTGEAGRE